MNRPVVPQSVFDRMYETFSQVYDKKGRVRLLSMLAKSISEYKVGNYATALVLAWVVIEWYLKKYWDEKLDEIKADDRLNSERKQILKNPASFTASVMSEILELLKIIPQEIYKHITKARKKRNAFVHSHENIENTDCQDAYAAAIWLIKQDIGVDLFLDMRPTGIAVQKIL